ncbi:hypothetical protein B0H14DRAFT_2604850 [Mycena olivaceomarginata]|nr:hypothetical protein B0H14DRAFT_2604850 [Mycena olivaceomarginata]
MQRLSLPSCLSAGLPNVGRVLVRTIQNAKNTEVGLTLYNGVNWEHRLASALHLGKISLFLVRICFLVEWLYLDQLANIFRNLNDPGSLLSLGVQISIDPRKLSWQTIVALSKRNLELLDLVQQPNGLSKKPPTQSLGNLISVSFLSGVHSGGNFRTISVGLERKGINEQTFSDSSSQLTFQDDGSSPGLPQRFNRGWTTLRSMKARTSEESEIWEWCRALRTAFFNRTASDFETKPSVHEQDVEEVHQLFRIMNSTLVSPLYIKKIKQRRNEFGRHAQELYNKWVNVCALAGVTLVD